MARARPLSEIVDEAYRLADAVRNDMRHPRPDVIRWANKGLAELCDLIGERNGRDWFRSSASITLTGATEYPLPATFYKLVGIRRQDGGALTPYAPAQEAELRDSTAMTGTARYYQLRGAEISVLPASTGTLTLDFIANFADLVAETDTFDGVAGWEDYASLYAAKRMAIRDESPELVGILEGELGKMAARVRAMAATRDVGAPKRVKDVRGQLAHARRRWFR